jgi:hypothetical protein
MKDVKKMFAHEHVIVIGSLFGTKYIDPKTGKEMSRYRAMKFLNGEY